ncbi:hypothetical protein BSZ19_09350 [Bradyrhizobium japonicum]|uniref:DUF4189 domain-containing protein n=1 Tax=Bradyrhizobium japonicum TaxID=375 RepID=A0A1Y2JTL1_BRAJP|nr:DUF4189 domain-containing protein [Bradyrhizobium japonicum]OSJ35210.1 hypothetical protein BSZ19_09350 [Bradyrhizobium japonicum]
MRKLIIGVLALFISNTTAFAGSGAIAYSKADDVVGVSHGCRSQKHAKRWALLDCRRKGGSDCQIEAYESNACAAVAIGNGRRLGRGWWSHPLREFEEELSQQGALAGCNETGDEDCKLRAWVCH